MERGLPHGEAMRRAFGWTTCTDYLIEIWRTGVPRNLVTYYGLAWSNWAAACPNP